jgi:arabinogalactan oligomer/maltooligosaccharide transport system substrate-binding protein
MSPQACGTESMRWLKDDQGKTYYETNWDNATGVKVSEYMQSILQPAYANGEGHLVTGSNDKIIAGFQDGTMIAAVSGTWMEADLKAAIGENLRATKLPEYHIDGDAYQMTSFTGSKVYAVNRYVEPEYQEMALKVADLLVNYKEAQLQRFEIRQSIPCNKEAMEDARYTEHKTIGGAALEAQCSAAACVQSLTAQGRYWDIGAAIGTAYLDGDLGEAANWEEFLALQCVSLRRHVA